MLREFDALDELKDFTATAHSWHRRAFVYWVCQSSLIVVLADRDVDVNQTLPSGRKAVHKKRINRMADAANELKCTIVNLCRT